MFRKNIRTLRKYEDVLITLRECKCMNKSVQSNDKFLLSLEKVKVSNTLTLKENKK